MINTAAIEFWYLFFICNIEFKEISNEFLLKSRNTGLPPAAITILIISGIVNGLNKIISVFFDGMLSAGLVWAINAIIEWFEENRPKKD